LNLTLADIMAMPARAARKLVESVTEIRKREIAALKKKRR